MEHQDKELRIRNDFNPCKVVLFDLGGVLLKLRDPLELFGFEADLATFQRTWIQSPAVRALESGRLDGETFARRAVEEMGLRVHWRDLLRRFGDWPEGFYPEAASIIRRIPARYACAILSNTNPIHWGRIDLARHFGDRIDRSFLSFESGLLKPDPDSFAQVYEYYGCQPAEILFFDDNPVNVEGAQKQGLQALRANGPEELEAALVAAGII